jgi:multicomponent K+:H+ antiporter subunit E
MKTFLPSPMLSFLMMTNWLLVQMSLAPADVLIGIVLALGLPFLTIRFWPDAPRVRHPAKVVKYVVVFLYDVLIGGLQVAWWIIGPQSKLHPQFVFVPLDLRHPFSITMLASTISLTPGTVSAHVSGDRRLLIVHCLNAPDGDAMVRGIKERYEAPLMEILE